jgi:tRNA(fMet)-specific endonuclease VapC
MTPKFMLDTNICIYLMKHNPPEVVQRFEQCYVGEVVMSAITLAELEFGVVCSSDQARNRAALDALIEDIVATPFDAAAALAYGAVRLASRERKKDTLDKLIAAQAIALGVTLVTNNEADFVSYPGIKIENWAGSQ